MLYGATTIFIFGPSATIAESKLTLWPFLAGHDPGFKVKLCLRVVFSAASLKGSTIGFPSYQKEN
jgi:hypothetical protein